MGIIIHEHKIKVTQMAKKLNRTSSGDDLPTYFTQTTFMTLFHHIFFSPLLTLTTENKAQNALFSPTTPSLREHKWILVVCVSSRASSLLSLANTSTKNAQPCHTNQQTINYLPSTSSKNKRAYTPVNRPSRNNKTTRPTPTAANSPSTQPP